MGSEGDVFSRGRRIPGRVSGLISPPRKWPSLLLSEEVTSQTLADTTYVRLVQTTSTYPDASEGNDNTRGGGAAAWSWLKRPGLGEVLQLRLPKSRTSLPSRPAWPCRTPAPLPPPAQFRFDPSKRWPQGW